MKTLCNIIFLLALLGAKAQDTIVYKNGLRAPAVLKEISPTEIRYQRVGMPDGPDYVISKAEVDHVIYKNGLTEHFQPALPVAKETTQTAVYSTQEALPAPYSGKITYATAKKNYKTLQVIALNHPDARRQPPLSELARDIRRQRNAQDATRTGAIVCGGLAIGGTLLFGLAYVFTNGNTEPAFAVPPAVLGGVALTLGSVSIVHNIRLRNKRKEFVDLYNE